MRLRLSITSPCVVGLLDGGELSVATGSGVLLSDTVT